jgi:hypothetical protein
MAWKNAGKVTLYINEAATEENRQPHIKGSLEVTEAIPAGTNLSISGWLNYQGTKVKSTSLALSYKEGEAKQETKQDKLDKLPF